MAHCISRALAWLDGRVRLRHRPSVHAVLQVSGHCSPESRGKRGLAEVCGFEVETARPVPAVAGALLRAATFHVLTVFKSLAARSLSSSGIPGFVLELASAARASPNGEASLLHYGFWFEVVIAIRVATARSDRVRAIEIPVEPDLARPPRRLLRGRVPRQAGRVLRVQHGAACDLPPR